MPKLIKSYIDSLKIEEKAYEVWDTEVKGFGCMVYPSGRKTYYFLYRSKSAKKQRLKVGVHGTITCEIAREIVKGWAGDLARGLDPKEHKKQYEAEEKKSITMETFLTLFIEKYKKIYNKENTLKRDINRIKNVITPFFGHKKISEVIEEDILQFQNLLKNTPVQFNRCKSILSKAFKEAELWGYRTKRTNPCEGIKNYPEKKRKRYLNDEELKKWEEILRKEEIIQRLSPYGLAGIRVALYTGCRHSEVRDIKWENVFLEEKYIRLKDSKTGERIVALNQAAIDVLKKLKKQRGNPYVFPGKKPKKPLSTFQSQWRKIRKQMGLEDVTLHDLRHSFASFAIRQGLELYHVSKLLGHRNLQTTTRYAHIARKELIKSAGIVGKVFQDISTKP